MWSLQDVKQFYSTVGQRTQIKNFKTDKIEEYHKLEQDEIYKSIRDYSIVLEAGCGKGRIIDLLKDKRGIKIIGVEYVPEIAEETAHRFKDYSNVQIINGDISNMYFFDDNMFDYVVCAFNTLGTIPEPYDKEAVEEFKRVVKPDGEILISVYSKEALEEQLKLYDKADWKVIKYDDKAVYTAEGLISRRYSINELLDYFNEASDISIKHLNEISLFMKVVMDIGE